ncbi:MAG: LamG domain-containing protein [Polyangiales bacterium]
MNRLWPLLFLVACGPSNYELAVEVVSDLHPGIELDRIEVRLDDALVFEGIPERPLELGARIADLQVSAGDHIVEGRALLSGQVVTERRVLIQVRQDQALTLPLTRNCRGVRCGDTNTTCANATCVDAQCSPETPQFCASAQCTSAASCEAAGSCGATECRGGSCLLVDDGRCGAGFLCTGDSVCVEAPSLLDAGSPDASAGSDAAVPDAGVPDALDAGPRICTESWGELPVTSAAVLGGPTMEDANLSVSPASVLHAPTLTIEMWVRILAPRTMYLMGNETGSGGLSIRVSNPAGRSQLTYGLENYGYGFNAPSLNDGCWHHIALVRNYPAGTISLYADGASLANAIDIRETPVVEGEAGLYVGRDSSSRLPSADFAIHHLRFWNTALSDADLQALQSASPAPGDPRLIAEIPMQSTRSEGGIDYLDAEGSVSAFLGSWEEPIGAGPAVLMTLEQLDAYAETF